MKLLTKQILADTAAERWQRQYQQPDGEWRQTFHGDTGATYHKIVALGVHPKPEAVNTAVGNDSWTRITCDHCYAEVARAVVVNVTGGEHATRLCAECVISMMDLLAEGRK